jgi:hypothetical protein
LFLEVSHVGFGINNTELKLLDISGISINDTLSINNEEIRVTSVDASKNTVGVTRGINNTVRQNHFDGNIVSFSAAKYTFTEGSALGGGINSPIVKSYDSNSQELTVVYDLEQTLSSIIELNFNSVFFDNGTPAKIVSVDRIISPAQFKFEFSKYTNAGPWTPNPIIEVQKYYRYKFITSHPSLAGSFLEFSPSRNLNILTTESIRGNVLPGSGDANSSFIMLTLGFGDASPTNTYTQKKALDFANYYYYDKAGIVSSDSSYLVVVEDPLQGEKTVSYVSEFSFSYDLQRRPEYDGSGLFNYTTKSIFALGEIDKISITNSGKSYKKLPTTFGVLPALDNRCVPLLNYDSLNGLIASISIDYSGKNYSVPKLAIDDNGNLLFPRTNIVTGDSGEVIAIQLLEDLKFTKEPLVYVVESDVKVFFGSKTVGYPKNLKVTFNGSNYYNDSTISSLLTSHQILQITNFDAESFLNGEIVKQYENGFLIAEGKISKDGFNPNRNILKIEKVSGEFKPNLPISGNLKRKSADVTNVFYTLFKSDIKSYYDNAGYYDTSKGRLSSSEQKIADSFFYQDYSYVVKSKTPINIWRKLVKQTVHPSGFKMFGEVAIDATAKTEMPDKQSGTSSVSIINLWDPEKNKVTIQSTKQQITQTIIDVKNTNIRRGKGSVLVSEIDSTELLSYQFELQQDFDGDFDEAGNIVGRKSFNMILPGYGVLNAANANNLFITIDGIIQEPEVSFTVSGSTITFNTAPLGERISNNQIVEAQKFVGRLIRFKNDSLNSQYFRKIQTIENDFNGITTRFPLYYDDGTDVVLDAKENLFVSIDGVIQENKMTPLLPATSSYYIDRTVTPNQIVFVDAPRKIDNVNRSRFFAYSVGNYERLYLESDLFNGERKGPFIMRSVLGNRTINVENDRTVLVFVEGILQIRNRAYTITGSDITFAEAPRPGQIINILYLYGRETEKKLTFYNFETNKFFNQVDILSTASIPNDILKNYDTVYQGNSLNNWTAVAEILTSFASTNSSGTQTLRIIVRQQNYSFDASQPLILSSYKKSIPEFTIASSEIVSITSFVKDDEENELVFKTKAGWMFGTELSPVYPQNIELDDLVKVDGERDYRRITLIPEILKKLGHRRNDLIEDNHWAQVGVTTYNGLTEGIGLSVLASIIDGKVSKLTWNNRKYSDYASRFTDRIILSTTINTRNGIVFVPNPTAVVLRNGGVINAINPRESSLQINNVNIQPNAFGYTETPNLVFVPQPPRDAYGNITGPVTGGGATGYVVMVGGEIIDVVLTNAGSGYSAPPKVYVTRGYEIYKSPSQVVKSRTDLFLKPTITFSTVITTQFILDIGSKIPDGLDTIINVRSAYDSTNPTIIITPEPKLSPLVEGVKQLTSIIDASVGVIDSIIDVRYERVSNFEIPAQITTIQNIEKEVVVYADFGAVDVYGSDVDSDKYVDGNLGNRFEVYENIKFMTDFGVASYNGTQVSEQNTLQEWEIYYPTVTLGDFADRPMSSLSESGSLWNATWPTINEYGAILDSGLSDIDSIVYVPDTSAFPSSGKLLIGKEVVSYRAWRADSASYLNVNFDVSNQESINGPRDIYFSPDGVYMYIVGTNTDSVHQYNLSIAWDITTSVFVNTFSVVSEEFNPQGLFFKSDGTQMYVSGNSSVSFPSPANQRIYQYTLTTPWDISTASYSTNSFDVNTAVDQAPMQLYIKSDGVTLFVLGGGIDNAVEVFKYTMSTPWDISTSSYDNVSFSVYSEDTFPLGISFNPDGSKFFVVGTQTDIVYEYTMSTAWDITTASNTGTRVVAGTSTNPHGLYVQPEGNKMFILDNATSLVYEYTMSRGLSHNAGDYLRSLV